MTPEQRAELNQAGADAVADFPPLTDAEVARLAVLLTPPAEPAPRSA